jgi:Endonuclease-reverse transcriptase
MGGDFNAQNVIWGSTRTNAKGEILEKFLNDSGLVLLNTGEPTRYGKNQNPSVPAIDLSLASPSFAPDIL